MAEWSKDVYSSRIQTVSYNSETKELLVRWAKGGKSTVYSGVPEELAAELANAASPGSMINTDIQPYYQYRNQ